MWHVFGFNTQERTPSVNLLYVHLQGEQPVVHDEADEPEERQAKADNAISDVMRYFGRPTQDQCANLTYLQYYEQFSVEKEQRKSKRRRSLNDGDNHEDSPSSSGPYHRDRYGNYIYQKDLL